LRRLTDDAFRDRFGAWSKDSKELAFYSNRSKDYNIFVIRPDASGLRSITSRSGGQAAGLLYPVFSPTGDRMVASRIRSDNTLLFDPRRPWSEETSEKLPMTVGPEGWLVPNQWSPDGARLFGPVLNATGAPTGVGLYDIAARKARLLSTDAGTFMGFAWLGDSRRVLYRVEDNIVLMDVDSGRRKVIPTGVHLGFGLVLSPDRRTVYVSVAREQADIWLGERAK
jgi:Tol biopolymer transport system component